MSLLIELEAAYSQRSVTLAGSGVTAFVVNRGLTLGATVASPLFSRSFEGDRAFVTGAPLGSREQQIPLRVSGSDVAELQENLDSLFRVCDDVTRQGGGVLRYRSASGSSVTRYRVVSARVEVGELASYEAHLWQRVTLALVVDPYGLAPVYAIEDRFSVDTFGTDGVYNPGGADWTKFSGNGSASVSGGSLTTATTTGTTDYLHDGSGHEFGDVQVTTKVRHNTLAASKLGGVVVKHIDANNLIWCYALSDGAGAGTLTLRVKVGGTNADTTTAITTLAASTDYWVRGRIEGNVVTVEWFASEPTPMATPTHTTSVTLSAAQAANVGKSIRGSSGILFNTQGTGTIGFDDFRVQPLTYRNVTLPAALRLEGEWGGTTDALAAIHYTASGGTAPRAMLYSWWNTPRPHNYVANQGAELIGSAATGAGSAYNWSAAAVSGVVANAATSIERTTTAASIRTGTGSFVIVCPATANSGASTAIYRRGGFKKGRTYVATAWVYSAAGTTNARIRLGVSGDIGSSAALALSTTYTQRAVTWTPTADTDVAYFAAEITAATGTTWNVDDVRVFELRENLDATSNDYDTRQLGRTSTLGLWKLTETSGSTAANSVSGGAQAGTFGASGLTKGVAGPLVGSSNTAVLTTGSDVVANFGAPGAAFKTAAFTHTIWVKPDNVGSSTRCFMSAAGTNYGFAGYVTSTGQIQFVTVEATVSTTLSSTAGDMVNGLWHKVDLVYTGTQKLIYVNGRLVAVATTTYTNTSWDATAWNISSTGGVTRLTGTYGEISYANAALDAETIWLDYVAGRAIMEPETALGGFGPGIIPAAAYSAAHASLSGSAFTQTTDADYLVGAGPQASGALSTNGNLDFPILPHLFTPDDYTSDEIDVAVFARIEVASTQTSLACTLSVAPERGTSYGNRRYSNYRSSGKTLTLPLSGTRFKPYYLGRITLKIDRTKPRREWLRLALTNSGAATGTVGVDYLIVVPARSLASSQRGAADAIVPSFIASTSETTKAIGLGTDGEITGMLTGTIVDHTAGDALTPDASLLGEPLRIPADSCELLAWPSDQVIDLTDSSDHTMAETYAGTIRVDLQPRTHLLKQT